MLDSTPSGALRPPVFSLLFDAIRVLLCPLAIAVGGAPLASAATIHVDDNTCPAVGAGTLASPYCSIRSAICVAVEGDTVSVANGTYNLAVRMKPGVSLISQNGPSETIINAAGQPCTFGDFCNPMTTPLQCAAVTFPEGATPTTVLDGFTISGGAGRILTGSVGGGGIYVFSSPTIRNNIITNNVLSGPAPEGTVLRGAGVYVAAGAPIITRNTISNNVAVPGPGFTDPNGVLQNSQGFGGGIWIGFFSAPTVIDNIIQNNVAGDPNVANSVGSGGGLVVFPGSGATGPLIDRNLIADNDSDTTGGGISVMSEPGNVAVAKITNNVIVGNSGRSGGGVYTYFSSVDLVNNTIVANDALRGAGIYHGETSIHRPVRIVNNIIRSNVHRQFGDGGGIYWVVDQDPNVVPSISFNIISANQSNQCAGDITNSNCAGVNGNLNSDPLFQNPGLRNFHIAPPSPALDAANNALSTPLDYDRRPRGFNGTGAVNMPRPGDVDIGALEYSPCTPGSDPCDGSDNDCDGQTDEGFNIGQACDGVGACGAGVRECATPSTARCSTDPGGSASQVATETCDQLDNDCDGTVDETFQIGTPCDGIGQCGAGVFECTLAGTALCSTDAGGSQSQAVAETCDTLDNDCDGLIDDSFNTGQSCDGVGACGAGVFECASTSTTRCSTDAGGSASQVQPETCDALDNDCDGVVNNGFNIGQACDGVGPCGAGVRECAGPSLTRCSTDAGGSQSQATTELCDAQDNDCDGTADDGFNIGGACDGVGACGAGIRECNATGGARCSTDPGGSSSQVGTETCNGIDDDCDGATDEFVSNGCGTCGALPPDDTCNSIDDNCNGVTDEGCCTSVSATNSAHVSAGRAHITNVSCGTTTLFSDNFESGTLTGWTLVGTPVNSTTTPIAGARSLQLQGTADEVWREFNTSGLTNITLSYQRNSNSQEAGDIFEMRYSTNGGANWTVLDTFNGPFGLTSPSVTLPAHATLRISFRNVATSTTGDNVYIDTILITYACLTPTYFANVSNDNMGTNGSTTTLLRNQPIGSATWRIGACATCQISDLTCNGVDDDCNGTVDDGQAERCDGIDNDCDTGIDEGFSIGAACDGIGECGAGVRECRSFEQTRCSTDAGGSASQATSEICNGLDDDCDGVNDEGLITGTPCEGVGQCGAGVIECDGSGGVQCSTEPGGSSNQATTETCNGVDDDCDGVSDEDFVDSDGDGLANCFDPNDDNDAAPDVSDCMPLDGTVFGVPTDVTGISASGESPTSVSFNLQNVGSATSYEVVTGLTRRVIATGGFTEAICAATPVQTSPWLDGRPAPPAGDSWFYMVRAFNICGMGTFGTSLRDAGGGPACPNAVFDLDADGSPSTLDCDDTNPLLSPANPEICDGLDNTCNDVADEGNPGGGVLCGAPLTGECNPGQLVCTEGELVCINAIGPGPEFCDGLDNDCDDIIDNNVIDTDNDGLDDCTDTDDDNDLIADVSDCVPLDSGAFAPPTALMDDIQVLPSEPTGITWSLQNFGAATVYDIATGEFPGSGFTAGFCLDSVTAPPALDLRDPPFPGVFYYYMIRARNACGAASFGSLERDTHPGCQ